MERLIISCDPDCGCDSHDTKRLAELAGLTEAPSDYNLKAKYDAFNRALFNGELPDIPIEWATLKNAGGRVTCRIIRNGPKPPRRLVNIGAKVSSNATLVPGSMKMQISDLYKRSEVALDAILLHEMIHVYFNHHGQFDENHGPRFRAMAKRLSQNVGFDVPMEDKVDGLELVSLDTKPYGVVLVNQKDKTLFAMTSDKNLRAKLGELQEKWERRVGRTVDSVVFAIIDSQPWTVAGAKYPIQRNVENFYRIENPELVADLKANGQVLWQHGN